jgi:hypothetical protein
MSPTPDFIDGFADQTRLANTPRVAYLTRWLNSHTASEVLRHWRPERRERHPRRAPPQEGLRTADEAAAKLRCSIKTLRGHVRSGALRYVVTGHGIKRPHKMFTDADIDEFIANQTRKEAPASCPSLRTPARRSSGTTSRSEVIAFSARPNARTAAKPKR